MTTRFDRLGKLLRRGGRSPVVTGGAFNPLADPDTVGVWLAKDASDDGSTLSIPNRVSGGTPFERTSAGRAVIDATGLDDVSVGIDFGSSTAALRALIGAELSGVSQATVIVYAQDPTTTGSILWRYGTSFQTMFLFYNVTTMRRFQSDRIAVEGTAVVNTIGRHLTYPRAVAWRFDRDGAEEDPPLWIDGTEAPDTSRSGPTATTGALSNGTFYLGGNSNDTSPFKGQVGGVAIVKRALTDAEVTTWSSWMATECGFPVWHDVMWVGDSITAHSNALYSQWREEVQALYDAEGDGVRFYRPVGPYSTGSPTWSRDFALAGGGLTTVTMLAQLSSFSVGTRYQPSIIPILLGTNDLASVDAATLETRMGDLVDDIATRCPNALLVLQKLLPRTDNATYGARVIDWNDNYHNDFVATKVGEGVNIISDDTLATLSGITYVDGLHPDLASTGIMGAAAYAALRGWASV